MITLSRRQYKVLIKLKNCKEYSLNDFQLKDESILNELYNQELFIRKKDFIIINDNGEKALEEYKHQHNESLKSTLAIIISIIAIIFSAIALFA